MDIFEVSWWAREEPPCKGLGLALVRREVWAPWGPCEGRKLRGVRGVEALAAGPSLEVPEQFRGISSFLECSPLYLSLLGYKSSY